MTRRVRQVSRYGRFGVVTCLAIVTRNSVKRNTGDGRAQSRLHSVLYGCGLADDDALIPTS
jgi:hypothetical protein